MSMSNAKYHLNQISAEQQLDKLWLLIDQQKASDATTACQRFTKQYPSNADGWFALSFLQFQLRQASDALCSIDNAIIIEPDNAQWQVHKAHTLLLLNKKTQALELIEILDDAALNIADVCAELAMVCNKLSDFDNAEKYYQKAILLTKQADKKAQLYFNLAAIERFQGKIDRAEANLELALNINPFDYEANLLLSSLRKQTSQKNHLKQLSHLLSSGIEQPINQAQIHYALAKELEDLTQYAASFKSLAQGAKIRRDHIRYDVAQDIATINQIIATFNQPFIAQQVQKNEPCCHNTEAIFVLGLPRTGSTLIERIISNHSDVDSAGELNNFSVQMMNQVKAYVNKQGLQAPQSKAELVTLTSQLDFSTLGKAYIDSTRPNTGKSKCFIDKLPLNSLYVGLIHLALPKAKIVHVTRHPLDTCYAIYKQLFTQGYPFSYDLTELGEYYIAHHKMMLHWQKVLPNSIYPVAYEDVIDNTEEQAKALIEYCELNWQRQCIEFNNNKAPSTTASASQVRQDIYKSSKGKWRHYVQQLAPLKVQLEQAGICCD